MSEPKQVAAYRLNAGTLKLVDALAGALGISKPNVVQCALDTLYDAIRVAQADMHASLAVIRQRHPDASELTIDVSAGAGGGPEATARIDGVEHADVGARAALSAAGDAALVFLMLPADLPDGPPAFVTTIGSEALLIRSQFPVAEVPWPPQNLRVVLDLKLFEPAVPEAVHALANA